MPLTIAKAEGVTVFTITSNPKSKCPLICQLLSTLCCSPVCFVSQGLKQQLGRSLTALGTLQILVGLLNIGVGAVLRSILYYYSALYDGCFWLGALFIASGIVCILSEKFPSPCLLGFTTLVNLVSAGLAITAVVLYSVEIVNLKYYYNCDREYDYSYYRNTPSPLKEAEVKKCEHYAQISKMIWTGLNIMMIVVAVLQLCVTISACVLVLKALCKKKKGDEMDPELHKPLVEEVLSSPAC
ncbi:hypothetical protein NFI96_019568 [Prochilodus magdalenae]|nr:hypothetical protein NFI96_019568 [Prochilodus magdalenae]